MVRLLTVVLAAGAVGAAAAPTRAQPDAARPCEASELTIALGPSIAEKTGQHSLVVRLTSHARSVCALDGYPTIALSDSRGVLPFHIRRGGRTDAMVTTRRPTRVLLRTGGHAFVVVNKYRCDRGDERRARTLRLGLPAARRPQLSLAVPTSFDFAYCGRGDPGSTVATAPFEPTIAAALGRRP